MTREISNYLKIVNVTQSLIHEKIGNIKLHHENRSKRGIFNGLGYVIKGITGNLDANDGEKIYKILDHLKRNEGNIENQLKMQYSLNHDIIKNFNDSISNIRHNEILLKSRILQLNQIVKDGATHTDILVAKDLLNQLVIIYGTILNVLQDIENSVTFCKLRTLHPSIITSIELFEQIKNLSSHYKNQFPYEVKFENILDFENIIKLSCKIESNRIVYFLSLPIDYPINFQLFHLIPIPTIYESELVTVIPNFRYVLKHGSQVMPLCDRCIQGKPYHCPSSLTCSMDMSCEREILLKESSHNCTFTRIRNLENHVEILPELNQYLAVFLQTEKIQIICENLKETKELKGIFLIERSPCNILFKNNVLQFEEKTSGSPHIQSTLQLSFKEHKLPKFEIDLKKLKFATLPVLDPIQLEKGDFIYKPSIWTIILYIVFTMILLILGSFMLKRKCSLLQSISRKKKGTTSNADEQEPTLPGGASF